MSRRLLNSCAAHFAVGKEYHSFPPDAITNVDKYKEGINVLSSMYESGMNALRNKDNVITIDLSATSLG